MSLTTFLNGEKVRSKREPDISDLLETVSVSSGLHAGSGHESGHSLAR